MCPAKAGVFRRRQPDQGKSQRPGARSAGGRATHALQPLDSTLGGMGASCQAGAPANASVAPHVKSPRGRACNRAGEGSLGRRPLADAADHAGGGGATAGQHGHAEHREQPSSSPGDTSGAREVVYPGPRDIDGRCEGGGGGRRQAEVGEGPGRAGPLLLVTPRTTRQAAAP